MAVKAIHGAPEVDLDPEDAYVWDNGQLELRGITVYGAPDDSDRSFVSWIWRNSERDDDQLYDWQNPW